MLFVFIHVLFNDGGDAYGHAFQYAVIDLHDILFIFLALRLSK